MTRFWNATRNFALAACLCAPLLAGASARADSSLACSAAAAGSADAHAGRLHITRVEQLSHFQAKPYVAVPDGAALWVRAPRGMTAADLHNVLTDCQRSARDNGSVLCVQGSTIHVERSRGHYVVRITSADRATALEIQRRAARK